MRTLLVAGALLAAMAPPALAGDVRIDISDRDFSNPEDVAALHAQITRAARRVCDDHQKQTLEVIRERQACVRVKVDEAVRRADIPPLKALHAALRENPKS